MKRNNKQVSVDYNVVIDMNSEKANKASKHTTTHYLGGYAADNPNSEKDGDLMDDCTDNIPKSLYKEMERLITSKIDYWMKRKKISFDKESKKRFKNEVIEKVSERLGWANE